MKSLDRRSLAMLGLGVAAGGLAGAATRPISTAAPAAPADLSGILLAVGFDGSRHPAARREVGLSVVTELDLATGVAHRQSLVPIPDLHLAVRTPNAGDLLLPLDGERAGLRTSGGSLRFLTTAPGHLFSGHALVDARRGRVYVSVRRAVASSAADTGRVLALSLDTLAEEASWDSGGVRPHDLAFDGDGGLLVSHYGDIGRAPRIPMLTRLDLASGKLIDTFPTPATGALTHIATDGIGTVCGLPLHYFPYDEEGRAQLREACGKVDVALSPAERWENRIAAPHPPILIDLATRDVRTLASAPLRQRRAQSVVYEPSSKRFLITYAASDVVTVVDPKMATVREVDGFDLGLTSVRGLTPVAPGIVAVSGELGGIVLFDVRSLMPVKRMNVALYDNPHLSHFA